MEFKIVAKNGKFESAWADMSEYTIGMIQDITDTCNVMYGSEWTIEYRQKKQA